MPPAGAQLWKGTTPGIDDAPGFVCAGFLPSGTSTSAFASAVLNCRVQKQGSAGQWQLQLPRALTAGTYLFLTGMGDGFSPGATFYISDTSDTLKLIGAAAADGVGTFTDLSFGFMVWRLV